MTGAVSRLLEMIHPGLEKGGTVTCLAGAMQYQLDKLTVNISLIGDSFNVDSALGRDLDSLGYYLDVQRVEEENDSDYRERLAAETVNRPGSVNTEEAVEDIVEQILGFHLDIEEYPDVDFVEEYGAQRNTGAMRIRVPFNKQLLVTDIERQVNRVKSAGIYHVIDIKYDELYEAFAELVTVEEFLIGLLGGIFDDTLATLDDNEGPDAVGVSFIAESIDPLLPADEELQVGIDGGKFDEDDIDPLTTVLSLLFNGHGYFTGSIDSLVDEISASVEREPFIESIICRVARIGTARIGINVIGGGFHAYFDSTWDNGEWDQAVWDSEMFLDLKEVY